MTVTSSPPDRGVRYWKTNPDCRADRHRPEQASYKRGCRCPATVAAHNVWINGRRTTSTQTNPHCTAASHRATDTSWRRGCRCERALIAHQNHLAERRREARETARAARVAGCRASTHGTRYAYQARGCRCPEAEAAYRNRTRGRHDRALVRTRDPRARWRGRQHRVSSISLWMLVRGMVDRPTAGERLAAIAILEQRGSETLGLLNDAEIGERIGTSADRVRQLRALRDRMRGERAQRRLADAQWKARRAAVATERKEVERRLHEAAREVKAQRRADQGLLVWVAAWPKLAAPGRTLLLAVR